MSFLEKLKFGFDNVGFVKNLIRDWKPRGCKSEKDFENFLYEYLHDKLESIQVTKQYAKGRVKADLVVGESIIIELKTNLDTTAKYQRLIGQLTEYSRSWEGTVILLLTGKTEKNLRKKLVTDIESLFSVGPIDGLFDTDKVVLFEK